LFLPPHGTNQGSERPRSIFMGSLARVSGWKRHGSVGSSSIKSVIYGG